MGLAQFFDTCYKALGLGEPGTDLLCLKSDQVVIIALLPALEKVSV
jgi:hypothetical protein